MDHIYDVLAWEYPHFHHNFLTCQSTQHWYFESHELANLLAVRIFLHSSTSTNRLYSASGVVLSAYLKLVMVHPSAVLVLCTLIIF